MTKKIAVDYNQETINTSEIDEQPNTVSQGDSKVFKSKQNSLINQRSQGSRASQGSRRSEGRKQSHLSNFH